MSNETSIVPYVPSSLGEAMTLATSFAKSRLLGDLGTPEQVLLIMATGAELGLPPTAAIRGIHVISGKPVMSADLMHALCLRSSVCADFSLVETTASKATYTATRKGAKPVVMSYTTEDATASGSLPAKPGSAWAKYPAAMLRHRCVSTLARAVFPDVVLGVYVEGEIDERQRPVEVEALDVTPLQPAPPPVVETPVEPAPDWHALIADCTTVDDLAALGRRINAELPAGTQLRTEIGREWKARKAALSPAPVSDAA